MINTTFKKDGVPMTDKTYSESQHLFLLFNITLLLTFPFNDRQTLLTQLTQLDSILILDWIPFMTYLTLLGGSFVGRKTEFTSLIRILCLLFSLYHLIHLLFYV